MQEHKNTNININTNIDTKDKKYKVAVGMSGGVDSSVSALLLKNEGYDVTGVYMQCWDVNEDGCASNEDKAYALQTAAKLGIKFISLDFRKEYKEKVISYFYDEYINGRTPNPDVMCNKEIKFGLFYDWAISNGYDFISTGHYAKIDKISDNRYLLERPLDKSKDQTYFLYLLNHDQLSKILFPIGNYLKKDVRILAVENDLPSAKRPESMGICFIGEVDVKKFLEERINHKTGDVIDLDGNIVGQHDGAWFYTIGQRHGFKLSKYFGVPMYVIGKDVDKNILIVGDRNSVLSKEFCVENIHLINKDNLVVDLSNLKPDELLNLSIRVRNLGDMHLVESLNIVDNVTYEAGSNFSVRVCLKDPIFGIAPGQSCVFYYEDIVIGGGILSL